MWKIKSFFWLGSVYFWFKQLWIFALFLISKKSVSLFCREITNKMNSLNDQKHAYLIHTWLDKAFKGIVVNWHCLRSWLPDSIWGRKVSCCALLNLWTSSMKRIVFRLNIACSFLACFTTSRTLEKHIVKLRFHFPEFKGTVSVISMNLPFIEWHVRFSTIPFNKTFVWSRISKYSYL